MKGIHLPTGFLSKLRLIGTERPEKAIKTSEVEMPSEDTFIPY